MASPALLARLSDLLGPRGFSRDPAELQPWLTDWRGRFHGAAAALLSPATTDEVVEIVRSCGAEKVPLVPQGGNSSMVGGATPDASGDAVILSLRRLNKLRSLDPQANLAVCEAGMVLQNLHGAAAEAGRRFPLTLGARGSATIGGLVSTNAGGTQVLRFGTMRSLVQGVEAVLPDGCLFSALNPLKKDNRGYDLTQLLIGAEGTLGIVTAAALRLYPAVGGRAAAWIGISSAQDGLRLLRHLEAELGGAVESFELVPRVALDLVLAHIPATRAPLAHPAAWNVLVEAVTPLGIPGPEKALHQALGHALQVGLIEDAAVASSQGQVDAFWRLRDSISEAEKKEGLAAKHDISVSVEQMPAFMAEARAAVEGRFPGTRVIAFGHLGDGNVHFNVAAPAGAPSDWIEVEGRAVSTFVHDLVTRTGGSISAEHGIGQMKLADLARFAEPARLRAMRAIKRALDPDNIMNPGKLVPLAESSVTS